MPMNTSDKVLNFFCWFVDFFESVGWGGVSEIEGTQVSFVFIPFCDNFFPRVSKRLKLNREIFVFEVCVGIDLSL